MSRHDTVGAVAGDDWEIRATLLKADGTPFDLSGDPSILWTLTDSTGRRVIEADEVSVSITDAAQGKCSVLVPATVTTRLVTARYCDALRLVMGGITSTLLTGDWNVLGDPFGAQALQATTRVIPLRRAA
jgi:hypothetical protein